MAIKNDPTQTKPGMKTQTRMWRPAMRDSRSYREVVLKAPMVRLKKIDQYDEWLNNAVVCKFKNVVDIDEVKNQLLSLNIHDIVHNKFDASSVSISRNKNRVNLPFNEEDLSHLGTIFESVVAWTSKLKSPRLCFLEITNVPLHLWDQANFRMISEKWGKVQEIYSNEDNFESVITSILTEETRMIDGPVMIKEGNTVFICHVKETCQCKTLKGWKVFNEIGEFEYG